MKKRNDKKIEKTFKAFNEIKETLTIDELVTLDGTLCRYISARKKAEKKGAIKYE